MKKLLLFSIIFLVICPLCIHAQDNKPKLNQVELMKKFNGTWQFNVGKDTVVVNEMRAYDNVFWETFDRVIKGKKEFALIGIVVYDPALDKYKGTYISSDGLTQQFSIASFSSENVAIWESVEDLKTMKVIGLTENTFVDPDHFNQIWYNSDKVKAGESKWVRVSAGAK